MDTPGRADDMTCGPIIAESQKDDSSTSLQHTLNHPSMVGSSASLPGQSPDSNATNQPEILKSQSQSDSDDSNESGSLPSKSSSTIDSSGTGSLGQSDGLAFKSSKRHKTSKRKKDRSKLRKGKWTLEEEEYTSRIIHYFSTGLLTLPEGATLRSYLADKLNCDPMRITKKYAGASCLGRRVYHFRDRVHPTIAEIQIAKAELDHLEQRFRLRIEGGHATSPAVAVELPPPVPSSTVNVAPAAAFQNPPNLQLLQTMLLGFSAIQQQNTSIQQSPSVASAPANSNVLSSFPQPVTTAPVVPAALTQMLLANAASGVNQFGTIPCTDLFATGSVPQIPGVDPAITNWALSQVAAALGPALSQLSAGTILPMNVSQAQQQQQQQLQQAQAQAQQQIQLQQQQQIQAQQQQQLQAQNLLAQQKTELQNRIQEQQAIVNQKLYRLLNQEKVESIAPIEHPPPQPIEVQKPTALTSVQMDHANFYAAQFKQAYDRHISSLGIELDSSKSPADLTAAANGNTDTYQNEQKPPSSENCTISHEDPPRTEEDKEGGTALLGFLSSLRRSYESVLREKQVPLGDESMYTSNRPATVTDSNSSQQRDSSVEDSDWNSDKKTDNSSSEDSEKEEGSKINGKATNVYHNQGPPRKRMKVKRVADAIRKGPTTSNEVSKNVIE